MAYLCLLVRLEKYLGLGELCQVVNAVQEIIKKARRSFFMFGSIGVYHGDLSPRPCVWSVIQ